MKRIASLMILAAVSLFVFSARSAMSADQIMDRVAAALTKPQSVSVTFSFSGNGGTGNGTMTVCHNKFTYNSGDLAVWYNGRSQWTLQRSAKEVSLTEPTEAELLESNPFRVISGYKAHYTAKLLTAPAGFYKIQLTARSKAQAVRSATVTVNAKTFIPTRISANMGSGSTTIVIKSFTKGKVLPKSYFEFDARMNKDIELIDLR